MPKAYVLLQFNVDDQETFGRYRQVPPPRFFQMAAKYW
jgi:uncharacterized protein (DUF1330 family)